MSLFTIIMTQPAKEPTILDRELKIKFYPGNDLLEVLGISQVRGKGFNKIIQTISDKNKSWALEEVINYALLNETENSNEELFLLTEYLSHRSLKNGYMLEIISKIFTRSGNRRDYEEPGKKMDTSY